MRDNGGLRFELPLGKYPNDLFQLIFASVEGSQSTEIRSPTSTKRPLSAILLKNLAPARIELFTGFIGSLSPRMEKEP